MSTKKNVGLRLDTDTLKLVDAYLKKLRGTPGWAGASRPDALRVLVDLGLKSVGL